MTRIFRNEVENGDAKSIMNRIVITLAALILTYWSSDPAMARQRSAISPEDAKAIAKEAYIYGFPMVMGYKTPYGVIIRPRSNRPVR